MSAASSVIEDSASFVGMPSTRPTATLLWVVGVGVALLVGFVLYRFVVRTLHSHNLLHRKVNQLTDMLASGVEYEDGDEDAEFDDDDDDDDDDDQPDTADTRPKSD